MAVARYSSAEEFGKFGIAFAIYLTILGLSRVLVTDALVIRFSHCDESEASAAASMALGAATVAGLVAGLAVAIGGLFLFSHTLLPIVLALSLPGLLLQDAFRFAALTLKRPALALANDVAWSLIAFTAIALAVWDGRRGVPLLFGLWGAAAYFGVLVGRLGLGTPVRVMLTRRWLIAHWSLAWRFTTQFLTYTVTSHGVLFAVAIAGLEAVAGLRAGQILFGPVALIAASAQLLAVPELVRLNRRWPDGLRPVAFIGSFIIASAAVGWGLILHIVPPGYGAFIFGESWPFARPVLLPFAAFLASSGMSLGAVAGLRALGAADRWMKTQAVLAPLFVGAALLGAMAGAAPGAIIGLATAGWLSTVVWWRQLDRAILESGRERSSSAESVEAGARSASRQATVPAERSV